MPRKRLNWQYDDEKQEFTTPSGRRISLHEIAGMLHDRAECRFDFAGPWTGWRMRGAALIPPHNTIRTAHLKPHNLAAFLRWAMPATLAEGGSFVTATTHHLPIADKRIDRDGAVSQVKGSIDRTTRRGTLVANG